MDSFIEGAALGGIGLCQRPISASVEDKNVEDQFKQSEAQSHTYFWSGSFGNSHVAAVGTSQSDNSFPLLAISTSLVFWFSVVGYWIGWLVCTTGFRTFMGVCLLVCFCGQMVGWLVN